MKFLFSLLFWGFLLMKSFSQVNKEFTLSGHLKGLKDGTILYLSHNKYGISDTISKTLAKNEFFTFKGSLANEAEAFFVKIDTTTVQYDPPIKKYIVIVLENSNINLSGHISDLSETRIFVEGSSSHLDYLEHRKMSEVVDTKLSALFKLKNTLAQKITDTSVVLIINKEIESILDNFHMEVKQWITNHPNSLLSPWLITTQFGQDYYYLDTSYSKLTPRVQKSNYGIQLAEALQIARNTAIGNKAPDFRLPAFNGRIISLKEVVNQGRVTLIDFWASWCGPCRIKHPHYKRLYEQYHQKGLNILSVSLDKDLEAWKKAISLDSLHWYNVREQEKSVSKLYGINMIPATFLLDDKGKIIAKYLYNEELEKKVIEVLNLKN